jgi:hypothetical protein
VADLNHQTRAARLVQSEDPTSRVVQNTGIATGVVPRTASASCRRISKPIAEFLKQHGVGVEDIGHVLAKKPTGSQNWDRLPE